MSRDLIGYGGAWPDLVWPGGARLAVSVVVNFEEGAEQQVLDGDPASERLGEVISVVPDGKADPGQAQIFAYGTRAGAWRMADALRRHDVPATIFACGRAAERAAPVLRMFAEEGHETACHGWLWRPHADYDTPGAEAADLDRAAEAIAAATGSAPRGFFCRGAESPWTRALLAERGYLYTSNGFDDDVPYRDASGLVVVPYALDTNDMKFFHPNGFVRASEMVDYVADALDVLEAEAARGLPRLLNIGFHLRIAGRPGRFKAFERILAELDRRRDRICLARRIDIAEAFDAAFPA
ncbi:polysaccharide deacetylase family protein [Roseibacterium sp. SDUM158017]|uniref:polysaccharide deacetylase family protein n=1 Tax=Roseicyclus salinarum TaxID=3036773 RepID=UPI00241538A7|nr:polysaccharide deacetylase family protein [Roseibacterium sp. SDUM158017]MDG4650176.1 polysaccharide deacetylase family protein [Roseibacterium sp. SDUM158017]